jgi:hypothetical protein
LLSFFPNIFELFHPLVCFKISAFIAWKERLARGKNLRPKEPHNSLKEISSSPLLYFFCFSKQVQETNHSLHRSSQTCVRQKASVMGSLPATRSNWEAASLFNAAYIPVFFKGNE